VLKARSLPPTSITSFVGSGALTGLLTGDYARAIDDFKSYVERAKEQGVDEQRISKTRNVQRGRFGSSVSRKSSPLFRAFSLQNPGEPGAKPEKTFSG
jgi:hypothetical protein